MRAPSADLLGRVAATLSLVCAAGVSVALPAGERCGLSPATHQDRAVLGAALTSLPGRWVAYQQTVRSCTVRATLRECRLRVRRGKHPPYLPRVAEALERVAAANRRNASLEGWRYAKVECLVAGQEAEALAAGGWERQRWCYPSARGCVRLARPAYLHHARWAQVLLVCDSGVRAGRLRVVTLRCRGGVWHVEWYRDFFVS